MIDVLKRLLDYDTWANRRALASVYELTEPGDRILGLIAHIHTSKQRWLGLINGEPVGTADTWPKLDLAECEELAVEMEAAYDALFLNLGEEDLDGIVSYTNTRGEDLEFRVGDVLLQTMLHSAHHRGQIALEVRRQGGTPAMSDYIVLCKDEGLQSRAV